jgi:GTP cyclohydrolase I
MSAHKAPPAQADTIVSTRTAFTDHDVDPLEPLVREMLHHVGEDPGREGLVKTPFRVAEAMRFLTHGYQLSVSEVVNGAVYHEDSRDMVIVKDIAFYSLCEHHLLPFFGKAHVAYIPRGQVIGLSKIPRIVDLFSRRLQMQERITNQVADAIEEVLDPEGVAVIMEGSHLCMMMRGVEEQESTTITASLRGQFDTCPTTREKLFHFIPISGDANR